MGVEIQLPLPLSFTETDTNLDLTFEHQGQVLPIDTTTLGDRAYTLDILHSILFENPKAIDFHERIRRVAFNALKRATISRGRETDFRYSALDLINMNDGELLSLRDFGETSLPVFRALTFPFIQKVV